MKAEKFKWSEMNTLIKTLYLLGKKELLAFLPAKQNIFSNEISAEYRLS